MKSEKLSSLLRQDAMHTALPPALRSSALEAAYGKEKPPVKKKMGFSVVLVLVLLVSSIALAVANQAGILDFAHRSSRFNAPDNAAQYMVSDNLTLETDVFTATLREHYFDGRTVRTVVDIVPKEKDVLLLNESFSTEDLWSYYTEMDWNGLDPADQRRVGEMALQHEKVYCCGLFVSAQEEGFASCGGLIDAIWNPETGVLTCYSQMLFDKNMENLDVTLKVYAIPAVINGQDMQFTLDQEHQVRAEETIALSSAAVETKVFVNAQPVEYPSAGVRVDKLLIEVKPTDIYATVEYTVVDEAAYAAQENELWFEYVDPNSTETEPYMQLLSGGLIGQGASGAIGDGRYYQIKILGYGELHETYTLRAYNAWTMERFEAQEIVMKPTK